VTLRAYLEGYRAALTTVALAFGLSPTIIASREKTLEAEAWKLVGTPAGECQPINIQEEKG
jgi:hypothetical protein